MMLRQVFTLVDCIDVDRIGMRRCSRPRRSATSRSTGFLRWFGWLGQFNAESALFGFEIKLRLCGVSIQRLQEVLKTDLMLGASFAHLSRDPLLDVIGCRLVVVLLRIEEHPCNDRTSARFFKLLFVHLAGL